MASIAFELSAGHDLRHDHSHDGLGADGGAAAGLGRARIHSDLRKI